MPMTNVEDDGRREDEEEAWIPADALRG